MHQILRNDQGRTLHILGALLGGLGGFTAFVRLVGDMFGAVRSFFLVFFALLDYRLVGFHAGFDAFIFV